MPPPSVSLRQATKVWAYVGVNSFGGPAGQIAVMHREVVDQRRWISERRFLHALNYCMVLPGPEAQQLATYIGWLMHGVRGGLVAGWLFVLPGFIVMMVLSALYAMHGGVSWVSGLMLGLQAAVVVIVGQALVKVARRTLRTPMLRWLAAAAFIALFVFAAPFPLVVLAAGGLGWAAGSRRASWLPQFAGDDEGGSAHSESTLLSDDERVPAPMARRALWAAVICAVLWLAPVAALVAVLGTQSIFTQQAVLFSKAAVVTFGGAYAVLAYVAQEAVGEFGWITADDMTTGLGLAETTPGPLILVLQFVGFLAAYNHPGSLPPLLAGVLGATLTVWVTFLPCFMFIFAGAPFVDRLRHNRGLHNALSAISAAVVGVIANLALWFALSTFFEVDTWRVGPARLTVPDLPTVDVAAVLIAAVAVVLVVRFRRSTLQVLGVCAALGMAAVVLGAA